VQVVKYAPVDTSDYLRVATDKFYSSKDSLVRLSKVYFDFNQYVIRPDQMDSLNTALELAMADEGIVLFIRGYTDVIGSDEYNLKLSEKRSLAIKQVLVAKGFPENRIYAIGQGKDAKSLATAEDEGGRKKNRRADLEIRRGKIVDNEFVETGE
jgi:OOP family OmpA-OmpF porin